MSQAPYPLGAQARQPVYPGQQPGYGPSPQQGYPLQVYGMPQPGHAPPQQMGYRPPPGQQQYGGGPPLQRYGYPPPQQQGYGVPPPQKQGYASPVGQQPSYCSMQQTDGLPGKAAFGPSQGEAQNPSYTGSDVPDQDVEDNENATPPPLTVPPAETFGTYEGYENTNFGTDYLPPPPPCEPPAQQQTPEQHFIEATAITEQQARDALLAFVAENCCYGKKAAKDMEIKDVTPSSAYHYNLMSFCESRSTSWKCEPYRGQPIDGPQNGPAPQPWDILAHPTQMFTPHERYIEVPHTATVKPCHQCNAVGHLCCPECFGKKKVRCKRCRGSGSIGTNDNTRSCYECKGRGKHTCYRCDGKGRVTCWICEGQRHLKWYIQLTVK